MTLLIFVAAITAWGVLRHQERRHAAEFSAKCARRGLHVNDPLPAVPALESILTVLVGVALVVPSLAVLGGAFASGDPSQWKPVWQIASVGLATGVALIALATHSLAAVRRKAAGK